MFKMRAKTLPSQMDQKEQDLEVLRVAVADLNRRLAQAAPILEKEFHFTENELREFIITRVSEIHADAIALTNVLRDMVKLDREKAGLDNSKGSIQLVVNQHKVDAHSPDLIGKARVAGRNYDAAAWINPNNSIRVALLPPTHGSAPRKPTL
jgi:hypothetical protein